MPRPQSSYFLSVSRDVLCFLRFWIVLCIYLLCIYREQSYGSHREMQINKTRSPTVEKNIMDDNLQGGPLKHVQETHFLFSLFFFFCKNSLYLKIHFNDKNHIFHKHLKIKLSLSSWKFLFRASQKLQQCFPCACIIFLKMQK